MEFKTSFGKKEPTTEKLVLIAAFSQAKKSSKSKKTEISLVNNSWPKDFKNAFEKAGDHKSYQGARGTEFAFYLENGTPVLAIGLGEKSKLKEEDIRRAFAKAAKRICASFDQAYVWLDSFIKGSVEKTLAAAVEGLQLSLYQFDKHLSQKAPHKLKSVTFESKQPKSKQTKAQQVVKQSLHICDSVNYARDLVNEPPNILNSEVYARLVLKDARAIKGVRVKILGKAELKREKMGSFLSVNAGSAYAPQLVHLTYTPPKATKKTRHIALVGKGLTFDTGGYSLKPSASMINMKFDMAGSATVYAAFRACALLGVKAKVTCVLGITDNAVNEHATMPDSIVKARNGKTIEILNTDAEGRLVLADCLDYTCDLKPNAIINAATLTGACLIALGSEMCGVMGNNEKLTKAVLSAADNVSEYAWSLPIIEEFEQDMKSPIADLKNIGGSRFAGTSKAAAFLKQFVKDDIPWAHLDIAGIGDSQAHLPYCPPKGASGMMVRTLVDLIRSDKF